MSTPAPHSLPTESRKSDEDDDKEHLLSFHNVHFHYPSRPDQEIFKGLDLHVEEGETLALVGPR